MTSVFNKLEDHQKQCIILVDEIYVKRSLLYHSRQLFGKVYNNEDEPANAVLGIMIKCQFGGPSFLFKMVPVKGMTAEFLYEQVKATLALIHNASGAPITIIADGNRTNQKFFNMFETIPERTKANEAITEITVADVTDDDLFEVDMKYYRKYETFTQSIDRGGLDVP